MAKRNSSASSGRRGSSKPGSSNKSFGGRSRDKQFGKKDSDSERKSRPFSGPPKRSDDRFGKPTGKSFHKKDDDSANDSSKKFYKSASKSASKFPEKNRREAPSTGGSFARSPRKFDKPFDKSSSRKENNRGEDADKKPFNRSSTRSENKAGEKKGKGFFNPTGGFSSRKNFKSRKPSSSNETSHADSDILRLNKYIANSGICSRREADEYIKMGLVSVNGAIVTELGYKVKRSDEVRYENKVLKAEKPVYILMNKPKGFITTTKDPQERKTVMHLVGSAVKERIYPVGRLDRNTTGLLLLTNDGDLADKLMHPSYKAKKIYKVELDRPLTKADFQKIREGVYLEEGKAVVDDIAIVGEDGKTIGIEIHIGWNRVIRRIFESLLYTVEKLDRTVYAGLDKKDLPRGNWRFLTAEEVIMLKHY